MATQTLQTLMTFEQYADLPEQEGVFRELDEGRVIETSHRSLLHGAVQANVAHILGNHLDQTGADFILTQNAGFLLGPDTDRAPDVSLVRKSTLAGREVVKGGSLRGAPDLAVEVVSPTDMAEDLDRKTEQYLRAGTTAVWIVYPETKHVIIHRRSGEARRVGPGQSLEEPELLPGLRIAVDQIFAI
ncbi:MAG TPA: Uma2 family endonuclease [Bryobacterales bacterium]|nr:Uma2 family endonuclease [Bryobacterales bacterium]